MTVARVAGLVLAAGRATRFGATKQLAELDGRPLLRHVVHAALAAGLDQVMVVVGHDAAAVSAALPEDPRVRWVDNPRFAQGQSTSLRAGLEGLGDEIGAAVVLLADQPGITPGAIMAVVDAWRGGAEVARAHYADGPGHPVCFDRGVWSTVAGAEGDVGARDLLEHLPVTEVSVPGPQPPDVDTPHDLA